MPKGNRGGKNGKTTGYYKTVGEFDGAEIITPIAGGSGSLPRMSNSPNAIYIFKNAKGQMKSLGIYNDKRELEKELNIGHGHRDKKGNTIIKNLKVGVAHVHIIKGGRGNNTRYMTKKEIKKYGKYIEFMGGRTIE
jgi:hypothetical protein